jgi:tRNA(Ile)-lysidine synthase
MTKLSYQTLPQLIPDTVSTVFIGYSGGIDSHVLLHLLAMHPFLRSKITAVYVHHGLQAVADSWDTHCQQQCEKLAIKYKMLKVAVPDSSSEGPEAAARAVRYQAFLSLMQARDVLLLAQHREDQLETVLLQLFRGGGVQGLAAMPVSIPFGEGLLLRPLLELSKQAIRDYAEFHQLRWIEDPTNLANDFDRNFLRNQIIPQLKQRWPALDKTVSRTAKHCSAAMSVLDDFAKLHFADVYDKQDQTLHLSVWKQYSETHKNLLLRYWLKQLGFKPVSSAVLQAIIQQVIFAKIDANPQLNFQDHTIRKYRDKLFCIPSRFWQTDTNVSLWRTAEESLQLKNGSSLVRRAGSSGIPQQLWHTQIVTVGHRTGGEKIKLSGRDGQHSLKKLFQEADVPVWQRDVIPLVYLNNRLAAVAGLWVAEWASATAEEACYSIVWLIN